MEDNPEVGQLPNPMNTEGTIPAGHGVEEAEIQENYGEAFEPGDVPVGPFGE